MDDGEAWRSWDRAALERAYSPSSMVGGDLTLVLHRYAAGTAAIRDVVPPLEVRYGPGDDELIDLYLPPDAEGDRPLHVFLHGGYWQQLGRADSAFFAPAFLDRGVPVAVPEYTLAPHASLERIVDQAVRAVTHLRACVDTGAIPATGIVLSGSSAGAHLAAMVLTRADVADAAVLLSGVYDLRPIVHTYVNDALGLDEDEAWRLSPLRLRPVRPVPIVVAVGGVETDEFKRQSAAFAEVWSAFGETHVGEVGHRNHFDLPEDLGDPSSALGAMVEDLGTR